MDTANSVVRRIKKANKDNINSMRLSNQTPELQEDEDSGSDEALDREIISLEDLSPDFDRNTYSDGTPVIGNEKMPQNIEQVLKYLAEHKLKSPDDRDDSKARDLIDTAILQMRVKGIGIDVIAKRLKLNKEAVSARLSHILAQQQAYMTNSEYRQLQINRLEAIINMLWEYAELGDPDQTKNLITVIERLNKMFELESEKSVIEVNIVTEAQSKLIITATLRVLEKVMQIPQVAELGLEQRVIDGVVYEALTEAETVVQNAAENPLSIEKKQLAQRK